MLIPVPEDLQTKHFALGSGVLKEIPSLIRQFYPGHSIWIVADGNTWRVAGNALYDELKKDGFVCHEPVVFPAEPRPHPDYAISEKLASEMPEGCLPLAVGSGVINDLVKCAAGIRKTPYCCVPTACSVDGYTSAGGAMLVNGTKKTVKCPAPEAIFADTDILATAPAPMFASGYADLLTKIPAGADWVIADCMGIEPIRDDVWQLIQGNIRRWVSDSTNMGNVFDGLAATGYSMQMYHESRPASGAEHLFSHIWEMEGLTLNGEDVSHGFKVGVGLLASTLLHEYVMNHSFEELAGRMKPVLSVAEREAEIDALLIRGCYGDGIKQLALSKFQSGDAGIERRKFIERVWPVMQKRLREQCIGYAELRRMLLEAHCPVTPAEIGLGPEQFTHGIRTSQLIRNRYTVTDLLYEAGLLDDAILTLEKMFGN